jgi:hypothetical protein
MSCVPRGKGLVVFCFFALGLTKLNAVIFSSACCNGADAPSWLLKGKKKHEKRM